MKKANRLQIREVKNNTVVFEDGTFVAVLRLNIPEFIKFPKKKKLEAIARYRLWLRSLDYPVQISAITINVALKDRLSIFKATTEQQLKKKGYDETMSNFYRFYKWLEDYIEKNAATGRLYYLVIPYLPDFKNRRELKKMVYLPTYLAELNKRVTASADMLKKIGIKAERMADEQLNNLYSSFFTFSFYNKKGHFETIETCLNKWKEEASK